jgi:hypothetical protein
VDDIDDTFRRYGELRLPISELREIVRTVDVVIKDKGYRIEIFKKYSLRADPVLWGAQAWTQMEVNHDALGFQFAWIRKELPFQDYPDEEGAFGGTIRELERITPGHFRTSGAQVS